MITVNKAQNLRASRNATWGAALSTSYPQSTFMITASNGAPLAPGQSYQPRVFGSGANQTTDPRSAGDGFTSYSLGSSAASLSNLLAPSANTYNVGGSQVGTQFSQSSLIIGAIVLVGLFLFFKK